MTGPTEETLADLIAALPPPPAAWVQSAVELPQVRAVMEELIARASADSQAREAILADLEQALRGRGVEPRRQMLEQLRVRLSRLGE
ncbi:MAG TPA: hypothetical protein VGF70_13140 [Solirubrobacteraceae bacterium]|jgi:hypothetical protein